MNCQHKNCNQTALVKVTFTDEEPYTLCRNHFEANDPQCGQYYQRDNPIIEMLTTR